VLLFNRAECYRTLGDREAALTDYRQFLTQLPNAPNRAQVEVQIAALDKDQPQKPAAPASPVKPLPPAAPAKPPAPTDGAVGASVTAPVPLAASDSPPREIITQLDDHRRDLTPQAPPVDIVHVDPAPMPMAPPDVEGPNSVKSRWWIWTIAAVVLAGGGVATYLLLRGDKTDVPSSGLGNYRF